MRRGAEACRGRVSNREKEKSAGGIREKKKGGLMNDVNWAFGGQR